MSWWAAAAIGEILTTVAAPSNRPKNMQARTGPSQDKTRMYLEMNFYKLDLSGVLACVRACVRVCSERARKCIHVHAQG